MKRFVFCLCMCEVSSLWATWSENVGFGLHTDWAVRALVDGATSQGKEVEIRKMPEEKLEDVASQKEAEPYKTPEEKLDDYINGYLRRLPPERALLKSSRCKDLANDCQKLMFAECIRAALKAFEETSILGSWAAYANFREKVERSQKDWSTHFLEIMAECEKIESEKRGFFQKCGVKLNRGTGLSWWSEDRRNFDDLLIETRESGKKKLSDIREINCDSLDEKLKSQLLCLCKITDDTSDRMEAPFSLNRSQLEEGPGISGSHRDDRKPKASASHPVFVNEEESEDLIDGKPDQNVCSTELESHEDEKIELPSLEMSSSQSGVESRLQNTQSEENSNDFILDNFQRDVLTKVVEKLVNIRSESDFERIRRFCFDENAKRLVEAVRISCASVKPENKTLDFLRRVHEASQGGTLTFAPEEEKMSVFFSHYNSDLLRRLCDAFQDWGETAGVRVVLLHGKPGTGKTESFKWLFETQTNESVAVVQAGPGSDLVGGTDSPGLFDILLLKCTCWRCLNMSVQGGELSGRVYNPSLKKLIKKRLYRKTNEGLFFHSKYFDMDIPVKNVVIACTSNSAKPADDGYLLTQQGRHVIEYKKVEYEENVFTEDWVRSKVKEMYLEELKERFGDNGTKIWEDIENKRFSSVAAQHLWNAFDEQVHQYNVRNVAKQRVSTFIIEGGEDDWLKHNSGK